MSFWGNIEKSMICLSFFNNLNCTISVIAFKRYDFERKHGK